MALNHLTYGTMADLTSDWVKPDHPIRRGFQRIPELAALLPQVDRAHFGLLEAQRYPQIHTVTELMEQRAAEDDKHDGFARATYYSIEAHIQQALAAGDTATARSLIRLRKLIFPHKLRVVNFSFREESGQAELLSSRLTPAMRQELATLPMKHGTVLDLVEDWLAAGTELGRLEKAIASTQLPAERIPLREMRSLWVRTINAVRTVADLLEELDPVVVDALGQIELAEAAAAVRISTRASRIGDTPDETPIDGPMADEPTADEPTVDEPPAIEDGVEPSVDAEHAPADEERSAATE